jgi:DNA-binding NarL/FixJ family response regulator
MEKPTIRVLIADDSAQLRSQLLAMLAESENVQVVGEAADANHAISLTAQHHPAIVVLDIAMPGSGIHALRNIKQQFPQTHVVMLTNHAGPYYKKICLRAGADDFVDKSLEFENVPDVIQAFA